MVAPRLDLRHKNVVPAEMTDRELFENMPMGDIWPDCDLAKTYFYARQNRHLVIPDTWLPTIRAFDAELRARVSRLNYKRTARASCRNLVSSRAAKVNIRPDLREQYNNMLATDLAERMGP